MSAGASARRPPGAGAASVPAPRVRRGGSYHGVALNVALDLAPFDRINPCGYAGLRMTQLSELGGPSSVLQCALALEPHLRRALRLPP